MSTSIPYFKKRKSFISITRKPSPCQHYIKMQPLRLDRLEVQPEWKSLVLNKTVDVPNSQGEISKCATARQQTFKKSDLNKQNSCANRPPIRIKPNKYIGSWHLLWCRETSAKSELIRLEREDIYNCDE